jgi:hypothetical protein
MMTKRHPCKTIEGASKKRFSTFYEGTTYLAHERLHDPRTDAPLVVYSCGVCGGYHLGHKRAVVR